MKADRDSSIRHLLCLVFSVFLVACPAAVDLRTARARDADEFGRRGAQHFAKKEYREALKAFKEALRLRPEDEALKKRAALCCGAIASQLVERGELESAIGELLEAVRLDPVEPEYRFGLGYCYFRRDEFLLARTELEKALKLNPRHARALEYLGRIAYRRNRNTEAIGYWEKVLRIHPKNQTVSKLLEKARREQKVEKRFAKDLFPHFSIRYDGARDSEAGKLVGELLERAYEEIGFDLGYFPPGEISVVLYSNREFFEVTHARHWMGALFDGKIRLPIKNVLRRNRGALRRVVFHEYTHALIYSLAKSCPLWLHEGLAQVMEGKDAQAATGRLRECGRDPYPLKKLAGGVAKEGDPKVVRSFYDQSLSFVSFLIERYGKRDMVALLRELGEGKRIDKAVLTICHKSLGELEQEWRETVRRR
jgi:cytochrome c-type biogenesis protein CcmH/NrfG